MIESVFAFGQGALGYIVPFLLVLTVVIFFHELGHFLVARWCGVRVLAFSLGFGPEIIGFNDRHGTRWRLALIPLGGYVKFYGDENAASAPDRDKLASMAARDREVSFYGQSVGKRAAIVAAGPIANFILAIVIFAMTFWLLGRPVTEARVDAVQPNSAAERAGFQPNDVIVSINGGHIESFSDMQRIVSISAEQQLRFEVRRGEQTIPLTAVPELQEKKDSFGQVHRVGILGITRSADASQVKHQSYNIGQAFVAATEETWFVVERTLGYIGGVVTGREKADQLSGPIRIAQVSGQAAQIGIDVVINLAAVLSISIGLLNLFPIPLLDGGHLLYYAIEALRGRPLSDRTQEFGFRIGIALVLSLMLFATWNDIIHLTTL
ncbi:RIP metalloprotease RseP [Flaviflagellibacter deserti]|jgi:regulator of sigma E protease|uniref:Zinc metalloprotease n=1 Tax=Flaviflagellibacter deserti TaxID=2267266 RepID=A0ABV9Z2U0_9HYPH